MEFHNSSKYEHFRDTIYMTLNSYYNFVREYLYSTARHEDANRKLSIDILECTEVEDGREIGIPNAFAVYEAHIDHITISNDLVERIENVTFNIIEDDSKATVVIDTALLFCAFHELGHLLIGHCQLIKSQVLNALYAPTIPTDELYDIYHLLEINADSFAAQRIVEKICSNILDRNHIDVLGYHDYYHFINDVVCGINIFFTVIGYLETDYLERVNPNEYNKTINIDKKFDTHPPSIVRNYAVLKAFALHLKLFVDYNLDVKESITSRMENFGIYYTNQEKECIYKSVYDGIYDRLINEFEAQFISRGYLYLNKLSRIPIL